MSKSTISTFELFEMLPDQESALEARLTVSQYLRDRLSMGQLA